VVDVYANVQYMSTVYIIIMMCAERLEEYARALHILCTCNSRI